MPLLDDIWYVGRARAEGAHAEFWAWHMLIKDLICIIYSKNCPEHFSGTVCPSLIICGMWVGLGPKVHMLNFGCGTCWSPGTAGVKNVKQCAMTTKLGQKNHWCKLKMMVTTWRSKVIRGQMWSTVCYGYHIWSKEPWCKLRMMMTFTEVRGQI